MSAADRPFNVSPTPILRPADASKPGSGISTPLALVFTLLGVLIGQLLSYNPFDDANVSTGGHEASTGGQPVSTAPPPPTFEVNVNAVVQMPTATATAIPKPTNSPVPTTDAHADDCNRVPDLKPGDVCRQPPAPSSTPQPIQPCPVLPGQPCVWTDPQTSGRQESE